MTRTPPTEQPQADYTTHASRPPLSLAYAEIERILKNHDTKEEADINIDCIFDILSDINDQLIKTLREIHNYPDITIVYEDLDHIFLLTDEGFWSKRINELSLRAKIKESNLSGNQDLFYKLLTNIHQEAATKQIPNSISLETDDNKHPVVISKTPIFKEVEGYIHNREKDHTKNQS